MNEFGQRSVASLLRASSSARPGAQVSLAEFLDRKTAEGSSKRCLHEDEKAQPDVAPASSQRVCDNLITHRLTKKRKTHQSTLSLSASSSLIPVFVCVCVCVCPCTYKCMASVIDLKDGTETRVNIEQQRQSECGRRPHLLVVGDMPMQRPKLRKAQVNSSHAYDHYVDGSGWWGEELVGMEEAGTACEWEGLASMSLGISAATSP